MQTQSIPNFCPVSQLLAAGDYAKHGWETVSEQKRAVRTEHNKQRSAEFALDVERTFKALDGRMTVKELMLKLDLSKSSVGNRLDELFRTKRVERAKSGLNFVYWRTK